MHYLAQAVLCKHRAIIVLGLLTLCSAIRSAAAAETLPLFKDGKPAGSVVVLCGKSEDEPLLQSGAGAIAGTVQRWCGSALPVRLLKGDGEKVPAEPAIVLTTLERLRKISPAVAAQSPAILQTAFMDDHGYTCTPVGDPSSRSLYIVSRTARGVFNGAIYARDFLIDGTKADLTVRLEPVTRSPQMGGRANYTLTIWGNEPLYTAADWERIFDSFARDGFDRVYFWVSGHFPSRLYPQT